jgi:uncharacterized protein YbaP (TraB family)
MIAVNCVLICIFISTQLPQKPMTQKKAILTTLLFLFISVLSNAQQKKNEKYQSLLWEISGNGLKKPSYLFGTMHVSNKLVFHLGDSFYNAIRNVETVALELNPDIWQSQMVRLDDLKNNFAIFSNEGGNQFLTEGSFRIKNYLDELKRALQSEPAIVNNLLYRSYKVKEDFEEDTFLDLYIYQTGMKLGKSGAGVENYYEAERLVMEAYADMSKEKKKKNVDLGEESVSDIVEKMQNAYRRGDLDLMDSLDLLMERSNAFREKFLYKRNDLQADAIDSIIRKSSLFVGVGAAHLPGNRGVIEILRRKGYTLRPVKMSNRNAQQKNVIDNMKVPVVFSKKFSEDKFYSVDLPGDLYKISNDYNYLNRRQYADMANGAYYMVTRVKTHAALLNETDKEVLRKTDSILYENIPGKILSRNNIERNGYPGMDIVSKTRRGDIQRYHIFFTPFEVIIFKMSGKDNYVEGKEAERFFSSIALKEKKPGQVRYSPAGSGFKVQFPQEPLAYFNNSNVYPRWEFESVDAATGNAYTIFKWPVNNFSFISEDSFDLALMEESFRNPDLFGKQVSRRMLKYKGLSALEATEQLKSGGNINLRYVLHGPYMYVLACRAGTADAATASSFFDSFDIVPFEYSMPRNYTDTFLKFTVKSPVVPELDAGMRKLTEEMSENAINGNNSSGYFSYWPRPRYAYFYSDTTGESVSVKVQQFPRYFNMRDSLKYWKNEIDDLTNSNDLLIKDSIHYLRNDGYTGIRVMLKDTGSSKGILRQIIVKNNYQYSLTAVADTSGADNGFINTFFNSFRPANTDSSFDLQKSRLEDFFSDLFNKDSTIYNRAFQSLSNLYYGPEGLPLIANAIDRLQYSDKNYFEIKTKLIAELGYINDSLSNRVVPLLKNIYDKTADTSLFQNEVVKALARLKTKDAYLALKNIFLQDPPIFEEDYEYENIFESMEDTLKLSATMFPELLQLTTLDDYKERVTDLLVTLTDSGYVKPSVYESSLSAFYIDARVAMKKQQGKDEKALQEANKKAADGDTEPERNYRYNNKNSSLSNYSVLLVPFFKNNQQVQQYFGRLLKSKDEYVRLNTAILLLRNKLPVEDSLFLTLAADDNFRSTLYEEMEKIKRTDKFPAKYRSQDLMARSFLVSKNEYDKMDSIVFLQKKPASAKGKNGVVYFYKYRIQKDDQWKIGMSGMQPLKESEIEVTDELTQMTDVKIKDDEPLEDQLDTQLKKNIFGLYKAGRYFFNDYGSVRSYGDYNE